MDEEREEGGPTSKTTLSGEHGRRSKAKRPEQQEGAGSPGPSRVSMKTIRNLFRKKEKIHEQGQHQGWSKVTSAQSVHQHQTELIKRAEENAHAFLDKELAKLWRDLFPDCPQCSESQREEEEVDGKNEEQRRRAIEGVVDITKLCLMEMNQKGMADKLLSVRPCRSLRHPQLVFTIPTSRLSNVVARALSTMVARALGTVGARALSTKVLFLPPPPWVSSLFLPPSYLGLLTAVLTPSYLGPLTVLTLSYVGLLTAVLTPSYLGLLTAVLTPSYLGLLTVLTPSYLGLLTAVLTPSYLGIMSLKWQTLCSPYVFLRQR
ncbi:unnamed protein product [Boreogadus saida]